MEQIKIKATIREEKGKQAVKKLRSSGFVPATVYHRGDQPVSVSLPGREITKIIHDAAGENLLINLTIEKDKKAKPRLVIVKEVQHDPVRRDILHVDLNEISLTERIIVEVEVVAQGESIGVKQEGGILDHPLRMIKVQCLPTDIPKHIDVDISGLKINGTIHVKDLALSEKLKVLTDGEAVLFTVKLPVEEKPEDALAETQEVEVIREKKEDPAAPGAKEPAAKDAPKAEKK